MNRLTEKGITYNFSALDPAEINWLDRVQKRLAAYEDTGLEPEEVTAAKHALMGKTLAEIKEFEGIPLDRLQELAEAERDGRVVILPNKIDRERQAVEIAMGFKLYDWQVAFIWGRYTKMALGRATGKTTAYILRLVLAEGEPLHIYPNGKHYHITDNWDYPQYERIFRNYVYDIYQKLKHQGGVKLRPVYFSREEAEKALKGGGAE